MQPKERCPGMDKSVRNSYGQREEGLSGTSTFACHLAEKVGPRVV
jgi:hypothetical protein